ncbi:AAA family ATPase [Ammoniphilus sp. YIM 78166]|uniref:AAA family ATPase n=1 Tax=Ammoniphilus sp. YIM 78166 TaxID=1644106 RepID=UPI00106F2A39|nr:AAA family ATPase [Ammoniphilus sp. YIM 78166]
MELLYLWIQDYYGVIRKQGFNFSSKYSFNYDVHLKELSMEENPHYIEGFFQGKISNVTGIVGENGSGKSTILDFIKNELVTDMGGVQHKAIIILSDNIGRHLVYHHTGIAIEKGNYAEYGFQIHTYEETQNDGIITYPFIPELNNCLFVFFSNVFDHRKESEGGNLANISTNHLVQSDLKEDIRLNIADPGASEVEIHKLSELYRQIEFIEKFYWEDNLLPFKIPNELYVIPRRLPIEGKLIETLKRDYPDYLNLLVNIFAALKKESSQRNPYNWFLNNFYRTLIINFLYEHTHYIKALKLKGKVLKVQRLRGRNIYYKINSFFRSLYGQEKRGADRESVIRRIEGIIGIIDFIRVSVKKEDIDMEGLGFKMLLNDASSKSPGEFKKFIANYKRSFVFNRFLDFQWRNLSSGENALLNIYSRFNSVSNLISEDKNSTYSVTVLIDEGELYLHPQWQKSFVQILISFLPKLFTNCKSIQVIITSNSPFILSDLPRSHVIFLKKDAEGRTVVAGLEEHKQTFAANIHTLLVDSFFMQNGLSGEFAKEKINRLIEFIINSSRSQLIEKRHEVEKMINIIGEPIIRNKLLQMVKDKIPFEMMDINRRIEELERQVELLRKEKEGKPSDSDQ